jgi:hypothetical protein
MPTWQNGQSHSCDACEILLESWPIESFTRRAFVLESPI